MKTFFLAMILCHGLSLTVAQTSVFDLAITPVNIFDSSTKEVYKNKTILIKKDKIAAILDADQSFQATQTIDGKGRLVTPGFIDTHVHLIGNQSLDADNPANIEDEGYFVMARRKAAHQYLAYGITTLIDMGQPETWIDVSLGWQKNPDPYHPDLFICGGSIVSDDPWRQPPHHIEVMGPEDGRQKVRDYAEKGLKYMKFYRKLRLPDYTAMADEAQKHGIIINTHVDNNVVTIQQAMELGVRNFEHFFTVIPSVLNYDEHWPKMKAKYGIEMSPSIDEFSSHMVFFFSYIQENPEIEAKLLALFDQMAAKQASLSTALNVLAASAGRTDYFTSFEYFPIRRKPNTDYDQKQKAQLQKAYKAMMHYVKVAHDKGVSIRIGTDCRFGGAAFLEELKQLTQAGIPVEEVFQIATLHGYQAMQFPAPYGQISVGAPANLILFEENPLSNIEHVMANKMVIKDGQVFQLKPSLIQELKDKIGLEGTKTALDWFSTAINDESYAPFDPYELQHCAKEILRADMVEEGIALFELYHEIFPDDWIILSEPELTNINYSLLNQERFEESIRFYKWHDQLYTADPAYLGLSIIIKMLDEGIPAAQSHFSAHLDDKDYLYDEGELNGVGYLLINLSKLEEAIAVFEMNIQASPNSWNAYDSYGEALLMQERKEEALAAYQKSVELNPDNENGKKIIEQLSK